MSDQSVGRGLRRVSDKNSISVVEIGTGGVRSIPFAPAPTWTKDKKPVVLDGSLLKEYEQMMKDTESSPIPSLKKVVQPSRSTLDEQRRLLDELYIPPPPAKRVIRLPPPSVGDFVHTMIVFPLLKIFEAIGKLTTRNHKGKEG